MHIILNGKKYANLEELEDDAKLLLSEQAYGYYSSGAESEWSLWENRTALTRYRLLPRMLVGVSTVNTSCRLFGETVCSPTLHPIITLELHNFNFIISVGRDRNGKPLYG